MSVEFDEDGVLLCPCCGFNCLHHDRVDVYLRDEDAKCGLHVRTRGSVNTSEVDTDMSGNPSERRDGLTIRFWCEGCDARPLMEISQEKGSTRLYFGAEESQSG